MDINMFLLKFFGLIIKCEYFNNCLYEFEGVIKF